MAANVSVAFDFDLRATEKTLEEYSNLKKINDFLDGKSKHKHLLFYYQKPDDSSGTELVDAPGPAKLMITTGEHEDVRIKGRGVYFLRTVGDQKSVKTDIPTDHELLFGEVGALPLESLNGGLNEIFKPIVCKSNAVVWDD